MSRHGLDCNCAGCEARELAYVRAQVVAVIVVCVLILVAIR